MIAGAHHNHAMLVQHALEHSAAILPEKIALVCGRQRLTYAEVEDKANRFANALIAAGLNPGDRVAIWLNNSTETVIAIYGTLKASGVFVLVNQGAKAGKLSFIVRNCRASVLVAGPQLTSEVVRDLADNAPSLKFVVLKEAPANGTKEFAIPVATFSDIEETSPATRPQTHAIDLDLACIIYTSGSTGEPKGVMCGHSNMVFAAASIIHYLENRESDVVLNVLPLSFDYGLYQLLMTFTFGGTLILEDSFAYPATILQCIERERVTGFPGVPTVFTLLLAVGRTVCDLTSLRYITNTAAALPVSHIEHLRQRFPWVTLYSMYGLTETKRTLYLPPEQLDRRPGSVGIAIPGTQVWIEDEAGNRLGPNQTGELVVRGRHVMRGYWDDPQLTAKRFRPGPLPGESVCYSGDLFRMDEEGYMYFVARRDDIIKSRGEKVAPKEVEAGLYALEGVVEAAVVGVPDPVLGQAVKAVLVVDRPEITGARVLAHCRAHMEGFMVPKFVEFRRQLPRTSSGKVAKLELL